LIDLQGNFDKNGRLAFKMEQEYFLSFSHWLKQNVINCSAKFCNSKMTFNNFSFFSRKTISNLHLFDKSQNLVQFFVMGNFSDFFKKQLFQQYLVFYVTNWYCKQKSK